VGQLRQQFSFDLNRLPEGFKPADVKLVISDMDSTFINIECIDEIADFAGLKAEVSAVTEAAMRGELDFAGSLTQRVALLKGLDESVLLKVYNERLQLNPGGEAMLQRLHQNQIKFALVSGGFTFFTQRLQQRYGLDYVHANTLDIEDGKIAGQVLGNIVGAEAKRDFLLQLCEEMNISPSQVVAVGDGANDLLMMQEAGLSVAYHAKPKVQEATHVSLNHSGLDAIPQLLGL
jgi:phosphoserine phosphatase